MNLENYSLGDWDDDEWCVFDNYMISCLQVYLNEGLVESEFVNLKIRQLSAATSHDFIECVGLVKDSVSNDKLMEGVRIYKNELYFDFINEYPDYGPKSRMTISRQVFYKWLHAYAEYKTGNPPIDGKDNTGRWIELKSETIHGTRRRGGIFILKFRDYQIEIINKSVTGFTAAPVLLFINGG